MVDGPQSGINIDRIKKSSGGLYLFVKGREDLGSEKGLYDYH
jgi:hypothetical protein